MIGEHENWIGRSRTVEDVLARAPALRLSATLGNEMAGLTEGSVLPPCWHWLYFLEAPTAAQVDTDGHARRGDFLPPIDLPRRMWAGSEILFHKPLRLGATLHRRSTIAAITPKRGRTGELIFVTVQHEIFSDEDLLLEERLDLSR